MSITIYSVSDINKYIKNSIKKDSFLQAVAIKGEVSNLKYGANGHIYFSLKDKESVISVCLWATYAESLNFELENGLEIIAIGNIDVYTARGSYSFNPCFVSQSGRIFSTATLMSLYSAISLSL